MESIFKSTTSNNRILWLCRAASGRPIGAFALLARVGVRAMARPRPALDQARILMKFCAVQISPPSNIIVLSGGLRRTRNIFYLCRRVSGWKQRSAGVLHHAMLETAYRLKFSLPPHHSDLVDMIDGTFSTIYTVLDLSPDGFITRHMSTLFGIELV